MALVACGWFGIQTWIGGKAIYQILAIYMPQWSSLAPIDVIGINVAQLICFLAFWAINMYVIYLGIDSIRVLLNIKAPLLIALGLALLAWAYRAADGFGPMLAQPSKFAPGQPKAGEFWTFFFPALTAMISFWATLSLNIPDFSRYARSQRDQILGQALGLPPTMALYSFIGVAVTSATIVIYGESIWDPVDVLGRFRDPVVLSIGMVSLCLATLATNIAANVVGPANDFSHLWPRVISFRTGGYITGILGILMQPWKLVADPSGYIFTWLIAYSGLLGAVGGILIADYYLVRRTVLDLKGLYDAARQGVQADRRNRTADRGPGGDARRGADRTGRSSAWRSRLSRSTSPTRGSIRSPSPARRSPWRTRPRSRTWPRSPASPRPAAARPRRRRRALHLVTGHRVRGPRPRPQPGPRPSLGLLPVGVSRPRIPRVVPDQPSRPGRAVLALDVPERASPRRACSADSRYRVPAGILNQVSGTNQHYQPAALIGELR